MCWPPACTLATRPADQRRCLVHATLACPAAHDLRQPLAVLCCPQATRCWRRCWRARGWASPRPATRARYASSSCPATAPRCAGAGTSARPGRGGAGHACGWWCLRGPGSAARLGGQRADPQTPTLSFNPRIRACPILPTTPPRFVRLYYVDDLASSEREHTITLTFPFDSELTLKFPGAWPWGPCRCLPDCLAAWLAGLRVWADGALKAACWADRLLRCPSAPAQTRRRMLPGAAAWRTCCCA